MNNTGIAAAISMSVILGANFATQVYMYKKGENVITRFTTPWAAVGLLLAGFFIYWTITNRDWLFLIPASIFVISSLFRLYVYLKLRNNTVA